MRSIIVFLKAHGCATRLNTSTSIKESFNWQMNNWKDQISGIMLSMNSTVGWTVVKKLQVAAVGKENELALAGHGVLAVFTLGNCTRSGYKGFQNKPCQTHSYTKQSTKKS